MIRIREATVEDIESVAKIHSSSWQVTYQGIVPDLVLDKMTYDRRYDYFKEVLGTDKEENVLIEDDSIVVGFMTYGNARDSDVDESVAEVWGIYIDPSKTNKGYGTLLINWVYEVFAKRKKKEICLWTLEDNIHARKFYEAMGYTEDGARKVITLGKELVVLRYRIII